MFRSIFDGTRFEGEVSNHCLNDGAYYADVLCGPRGVVADSLSDLAWRTTYTGHREFSQRHLQEIAGKFEQLAEDDGGEGASAEAQNAAALAKAWFERDLTLGEDQAANFVRQVCRTMRSLSEEDTGPDYAHKFTEDSLGYLSASMLYSMCKENFLPTCKVDFARDAIDVIYEASM